jgi:hypothetical protein
MRMVAAYIELEGIEDLQDKLDFLKEAVQKDFPELQIDINITYNPWQDRTKVDIKMTSTNLVNNFMLWHFIPKCLLSAATESTFSYSQAPKSKTVIKSDPLMMWHFHKLDSTETHIQYEKQGYGDNIAKVDEYCKDLIMNYMAAAQTNDPIGKVKDSLKSKDIDSDGDGVINEYDEFPEDLDNDHFPDSWEGQYGYDIGDESDPGNSDDDSDGVSAIMEYRFDTHPKVSDTDEDGYTDSEEIDQLTSPTDPGDYPS